MHHTLFPKRPNERNYILYTPASLVGVPIPRVFIFFAGGSDSGAFSGRFVPDSGFVPDSELASNDGD